MWEWFRPPILKVLVWGMVYSIVLPTLRLPVIYEISHSYGSHGPSTELVGGLEHFLFFHIFGKIIEIDVHIFQRGRVQPPTSIEDVDQDGD